MVAHHAHESHLIMKKTRKQQQLKSDAFYYFLTVLKD
jgi:hypothetical protein